MTVVSLEASALSGVPESVELAEFGSTYNGFFVVFKALSDPCDFATLAEAALVAGFLKFREAWFPVKSNDTSDMLIQTRHEHNKSVAITGFSLQM